MQLSFDISFQGASGDSVWKNKKGNKFHCWDIFSFNSLCFHVYDAHIYRFSITIYGGATEWMGKFDRKVFMHGKMLFLDAAVTWKVIVMKFTLSDQRCTFATTLSDWLPWINSQKKIIRCHSLNCWMIHSNGSYLQDLVTAVYRIALIMWKPEIAMTQKPKPQLGPAFCFMCSLQLKWWIWGNTLWILSCHFVFWQIW